MLRMVETAIRGCEHLSSLPNRDACLEARRRQFEKQARFWRLILPAVKHHAVNEPERRRADSLKHAEHLFGLRTWERLAGIATIGLSMLWKLRIKLVGDGIQPKTIVTRYREPSTGAVESRLTRQSSPGTPSARQLPPAAAAFSE